MGVAGDLGDWAIISRKIVILYSSEVLLSSVTYQLVQCQIYK